MNSWALKLLPGNKTGAQLTFDKPIRQNFLSFNLQEAVWVEADLLAPTQTRAYRFTALSTGLDLGPAACHFTLGCRRQVRNGIELGLHLC